MQQFSQKKQTFWSNINNSLKLIQWLQKILSSDFILRLRLQARWWTDVHYSKWAVQDVGGAMTSRHRCKTLHLLGQQQTIVCVVAYRGFDCRFAKYLLLILPKRANEQMSRCALPTKHLATRLHPLPLGAKNVIGRWFEKKGPVSFRFRTWIPLSMGGFAKQNRWENFHHSTV